MWQTSGVGKSHLVLVQELSVYLLVNYPTEDARHFGAAVPPNNSEYCKQDCSN